MDIKSRSDWNMLFSLTAIVIGIFSLIYCSIHVLEPLSQVEAPTFFAQLSRYIQGGV